MPIWKIYRREKKVYYCFSLIFTVPGSICNWNICSLWGPCRFHLESSGPLPHGFFHKKNDKYTPPHPLPYNKKNKLRVICYFFLYLCNICFLCKILQVGKKLQIKWKIFYHFLKRVVMLGGGVYISRKKLCFLLSLWVILAIMPFFLQNLIIFEFFSQKCPSEPVQRGARSEQVQSRCSEVSEQVQLYEHWEQVQRGWKRCSEVGAGAASWEQMQRDRSRCSEVEKGAARLEQVQRDPKKKNIKTHCPPPLWYVSIEVLHVQCQSL